MTEVCKVAYESVKISGTICFAQMSPNRDVLSQCTALCYVKTKILELTIKHGDGRL